MTRDSYIVLSQRPCQCKGCLTVNMRRALKGFSKWGNPQITRIQLDPGKKAHGPVGRISKHKRRNVT